MNNLLRSCAILLLLVNVNTALVAQDKPTKPAPASSRAAERLEREIRHELVMLPYYGVFDNLAFKVTGYNVELLGQVTRPTLKSDAEKAVKDVEGVESVTNNIEVLPLSPNDDRLRLAVYRSLFAEGALERYAVQAVPSIHIIVKNGHVTLEGVVSNQGDREMARIKAQSVSGVFSVTDHLQVQS